MKECMAIAVKLTAYPRMYGNNVK